VDPRIKAKASEFVSAPKIRRYWFQPEQDSITSIIKKYGGSEMLFSYGALSTATHGYHFGIGLFRDDSDMMTIDPMPNPARTKGAVLYSCRQLLELINIRDTYEDLGVGSEYDRRIEEIISFKEKD
jgi:hypothetical protein